MVLVLCLLAAVPTASAATYEDQRTDPGGDVVDGDGDPVDEPGIDILAVRVDDLQGDLDVSMIVDGAPLDDASYTVNLMVDGADLFTFSHPGPGCFTAQDPIGLPVAVQGRSDQDRLVWEVSTSLLDVISGVLVDSAYAYVTNGTGAVLQDSLDEAGPLNDPPTVSVTAPEDGATVSGTIEVTGTASDDLAVMKVYVRIDTLDWEVAEGAEEWSYTLDTTTMDDGAHTISVESFDAHTGSAIITLSVIVDNGGTADDPPMVSISYPKGQTVNGTITVTGTAADDGGVARVEVRVDGGSWQVATGAAAWSYELDTAPLEQGEHTVEAVAFDQGEQSSPVVTGTFWRGADPPPENQPPEVSIRSPLENFMVPRRSEPFPFEVAATDDVEVVSVQLRLDGAGEWSEAVEGESFWVLDVDVRPLDDETGHTVEARAFDGELYSTVVLHHFTVFPNFGPRIFIETADQGSDTLTITGYAFDHEDGIANVWARFEEGEWVELPFEPVNGSTMNVTWSHTISLIGLYKDRFYNVSFRASDGYKFDYKSYTFRREANPGGIAPKDAPGPGPVVDLLAVVAMAALVRRARERRGGCPFPSRRAQG